MFLSLLLFPRRTGDSLHCAKAEKSKFQGVTFFTIVGHSGRVPFLKGSQNGSLETTCSTSKGIPISWSWSRQDGFPRDRVHELPPLAGPIRMNPILARRGALENTCSTSKGFRNPGPGDTWGGIP